MFPLNRGVCAPHPDRPSFPVTGQTLSLKNISTDMSGFYICTSSNEVGTESCNITVAVRPRKSGLGGGRRERGRGRGVDQGPKITGLGSKGAAETDLVGVNWGAPLGLPAGRVAGCPQSDAPSPRGQSSSLGSLEVEPQMDFWKPAQSYLP